MAATFTALSDHTGVAVEGVDLRETPPPELVQRMYQAFLEKSVLVVRDQDLDPHQLLAAAKLFGAPFRQHNTRFQLPDCPEVHYLSNQDKYEDGKRYIPGAGYHTDHSNAAVPPKATILHAKQLPRSGGDTQYVNMGLAYETLDGEKSERTIRPLGLYYWGKVWTLVGWCELREDFRMFRVDRISSVEGLDAFRAEREKSLQHFFRDQRYQHP